MARELEGWRNKNKNNAMERKKYGRRKLREEEENAKYADFSQAPRKDFQN